MINEIGFLREEDIFERLEQVFCAWEECEHGTDEEQSLMEEIQYLNDLLKEFEQCQ